MNGKFRVKPIGFNRRDVIDYVKGIASEKGELIDANRRLEEELELAKAEIEELKAQLAEVLCSVAGIYKTSADTVEAAADTLNDAYEKLKASARQIRNTAPAMEDNDHEDL